MIIINSLAQTRILKQKTRAREVDRCFAYKSILGLVAWNILLQFFFTVVVDTFTTGLGLHFWSKKLAELQQLQWLKREPHIWYLGIGRTFQCNVLVLMNAKWLHTHVQYNSFTVTACHWSKFSTSWGITIQHCYICKRCCIRYLICIQTGLDNEAMYDIETMGSRKQTCRKPEQNF